MNMPLMTMGPFIIDELPQLEQSAANLRKATPAKPRRECPTVTEVRGSLGSACYIFSTNCEDILSFVQAISVGGL